MSKKNNKVKVTEENKVVDAEYTEVKSPAAEDEAPVNSETPEDTKDSSTDEKPEKESFLKKTWRFGKKVLPYVGGAAAGAVIMYFLDKKDSVIEVPFKEIPIPEAVNKAVSTAADNIPKLAETATSSIKDLELKEIPENVEI